MKPSLISIMLLSLLSVLSGQNESRSTVIEAEVKKSGRYAKFDMNRDGWDDLWVHLFPKIDTTKPGLDDDHDGKSNYEEMLDFEDPHRINKPAKEPSAAEILEARKASSEARRASDSQKRQRFKQLLESRGAMKKGLESKKSATDPTSGTNEALPEGSSLLDHPTWESLMLCGIRGPVAPTIIGMERLSNGQVLLAWEGEPDRLFNVEYSDDLVTWKSGAQNLPVVGGIGTWGQRSAAPSRFYRVESSEVVSEIISDPLGGDGVTTFGGLASANSSGTFFTIAVNFPVDVPPSTVELYIDGEFVGYCGGDDLSSSSLLSASGTSGNYYCSIGGERLSAGAHTAYAMIDASSGTTPGPDNPTDTVTNLVRTPEISFEAPGGYLTGCRVSEDHILSGEADSPSFTTFFVEYPYGDSDTSDGTPYIFEISDEMGNIVRTDTGVEYDPGAGQLTHDWNGTGDNGATLPDGPYYVNFRLIVSGDLSTYEPILVKKGRAKTKVLALAETSGGITNTAAAILNSRPAWWTAIGSSGGPSNTPSGWGPWKSLQGGPVAVIGGLQNGIGKSPHGQVAFWTPNNAGNAAPWGKSGSPATSFLTGNPFNAYDMGFLIGHGIASTGGTYTDASNQAITLPPQHYFPIFANRTTNDTVWIKSGQMAEKFGASGNLKWMYVVTCNYLREGSHNKDNLGNNGLHDIYASMKTSGTLPIGPGLHILGSYTTSCDVDGALAVAFSKGALQQDLTNDRMNLVEAWTIAWQRSLNSKNKDGKGQPKQIRNARSIYWPECAADTLPKVTYESITNPNGNADQNRLLKTDSLYP